MQGTGQCSVEQAGRAADQCALDPSGRSARRGARHSRRLAATGLLALLAAWAGPVCAQNDPSAAYPARPIRVIVGYAPGGATDLAARLIAQKLQETWGQPVVVENKPGAGSNIGSEQAARAAPDGYTLLMGT
ncbi:MAG: hypothetical protein KAY46_18995, partial [Burkholderiaceae bacterium]|nr:hypothetical protein [Burkholderiaceae bacterium]